MVLSGTISTSIMELNFVLNETMRPLAEMFFLPSVRSKFNLVEHNIAVQTSGNFLEDNFRYILQERTRLIVETIRLSLDDGIMLWSDVDVVFFSDCAEEIAQLANGNDILLQREGSWDDNANFGFQVIRRNSKTLRFYEKLLQMQIASNDGGLQPSANRLLRSFIGLKWETLPFRYSSESNGGCRNDSLIYHANCTAGNSIIKKRSQLKAACFLRRIHLVDGYMADSERCVDLTAQNPIYAYSGCGLGNRILGMAHTMELCRILERPFVLVWESNCHVGHVQFYDIFESEVATVSSKPFDVPSVWCSYQKVLSQSDLPNNAATILICNDFINLHGVDKFTIQPHLQRLRLVSRLQERIAGIVKEYDFNKVIGVHVRKGDKLPFAKSKDTILMVEQQYDILLRLLCEKGFIVYLSSDELGLIEKYKRLYGNRILSLEKTENPLNRNAASISDSVLEMYLLAKTRFVFYGVGTFGYTACLLGGGRGCNLLGERNNLLICFSELENRQFPKLDTLLKLHRIE